MPEFRQDIQVFATLYITADSFEEAQALAEKHVGNKVAFILPKDDIFVAGKRDEKGAIEMSPCLRGFGLVGDMEMAG